MAIPKEKPRNAPDHPYWTEEGYERWEQNYDQIEDIFNLMVDITMEQGISTETILKTFNNEAGDEINLQDIYHFALWMADGHLHDPITADQFRPQERINWLHLLASALKEDSLSTE